MSTCPVCGYEGDVLADLYSGAGGAGMGYHNAGLHVFGVDTSPQPRYPFCFVQADALTFPLDGITAIHASPPCQAHSIANNIHARTDHPDLIPATRERLIAAGIPYVIENVPGASLRYPIQLCGSNFGLGVKRHRLFELSWWVWGPPPCRADHPEFFVSVFGGGAKPRRTGRGFPRGAVPHAEASRAMGIDWMTRDELAQAIPPAYTEYIGAELMQELGHRTVTAAHS